MRLDLPEAVIDARFPRLRGVECFSAVLEPGEALLIPAVYLHEVAALEPSMAVNNYFDSAVVDTIAAIFVQTLTPPPPPPRSATAVAATITIPQASLRTGGPAQHGAAAAARPPARAQHPPRKPPRNRASLGGLRRNVSNPLLH